MAGGTSDGEADDGDNVPRWLGHQKLRLKAVVLIAERDGDA